MLLGFDLRWINIFFISAWTKSLTPENPIPLWDNCLLRFSFERNVCLLIFSIIGLITSDSLSASLESRLNDWLSSLDLTDRTISPEFNIWLYFMKLLSHIVLSSLISFWVQTLPSFLALK